MANFIQYLKMELDERRGRNPLYSLRAFARDLRVSDSMLSKILKQKKDLSLNLLQRFISELDLSEDDKKRFLGSHSEYYEKTQMRNRPGRALLVQDIILELLTNYKKLSPSELIKLSGLEEGELQKELDVLLEHKLIEKLEGGELSCLYLNTDNTSLEFTSTQLRDYQKLLQDISVHSIDQINFEKRLHCSMTLSVSEKKLQTLKDEIVKFQKRMNELSLEEEEDVNTKKFYTFQCSLFPLIDLIKKGNL